MRFFIVIITIAIFSMNNTPQAQAAQGCTAVNDVLKLIPGAFKTIMYYEGFRLHRHGLKWKPEVKCKSKNLFADLEKSMELLCSTIEDATSSGMSSKLSSIKGKLSSISGAENKIKDKDKLGEYLDNKMMGLDNDTSAIAGEAQKVSTKVNKSEWIKFKHRKRCRFQRNESEVSQEERVAESAAEKAANANAAAEDAKDDRDKAIVTRDQAQAALDESIRKFNQFSNGRATCSNPICQNLRYGVESKRKALEKAQKELDAAEERLRKAIATKERTQKELDQAMSNARSSTKK